MSTPSLKTYMDEGTSSLDDCVVTSDLSLNTMDLDHHGLIFGALHELHIREIIDRYLPKTGANVKLTHGEAAMFVIDRMLSKGENCGLHRVTEFAKTIPLAALLGNPDVQWQHINESVIGELLDRISEYGTTELSMTVFGELMRCIDAAVQIRSVHMDSTSKQVCRDPYTDTQILQIQNSDKRLKAVVKKQDSLECDQKATAIKFGYSRDGDGSKPQFNILHMTTDAKDTDATLPLVSHTYSGNVNDMTEFASLLRDLLPGLRKIYPYLKYIIGDCALATPRSVAALRSQSMHILSRMPDNRVKDVLEKAGRGELVFEQIELKGKPVNVAWAGEHIFTDPDDPNVSWTGRLLAVRSENMPARKKSKHERRADAEKKQIVRQAGSLNKGFFNCKEDAEKAAEELIKTLRYHSATVTYQEHKLYGKPGKPAADARYELKHSFKLNLTLNEQKMKEMIEDDSFYVLVTSDTEAANPQELITCYHRQSQVERTWRDSKSKGMYVDAVYLKNAQRIRAFMFLQSLALFVANYLLSKVHTFLKKADAHINLSRSYKTQRPMWETLLYVISKINPSIICDFHNHTVSVVNVKTSVLMMGLLRYLGFHYKRFYDPEYYKFFYAQIAEQSYDCVTCEHELHLQMENLNFG